MAAVAAVLTVKRAAAGLLAACVFTCIGNLLPATATATAATAESAFDVQVLTPEAFDPTVGAVTSGSLDDRFEPLASAKPRGRGAVSWLKLKSAGGLLSAGVPAAAIPVVVMHAAQQTHADLYAARAGAAVALPQAVQLPGFRGTQDTVFTYVEGLETGQSLYARVTIAGGDLGPVNFSSSTLDRTLARGAEHARMIALAFGALMAMALAALLIWFVLKDRLFILYASLFFLQALYIAYLSGEGFDWPWLSYAQPLTSFAWNVPVGLSGAVACLFTREIADLQHFSPRIYALFGWFAAAFVVITIANLAKFLGFGIWVNALGNVLFLAAAVFTVVVAFLAWRRGNRAAGWFLIAWALLEGFTMAAALRFLFTASMEPSPLLYYYGLPLSMVAAAVLIALGVADRLRAQRVALTEAERRAQTDPLTGVLNRRSLIERLDAACLRARARGLPIALLFIDLDHFKQINDSFGHQAGDACLRAIIDPIHVELRQSDVIGRYGGEEFVVILSSADAAAANPIAQRILERVAAVQVDGFGKPIRLTCSIGIAASDTLGVWGEHLIAQADAAVYVAKRRGRNQVQMAAPLAA
ncbi:MAG TPA: diguanylate cyclase [Steroidobacteraceae bacterium]|nr:diguanylate cyclase [Steroidobacteraceae bacterium]